MDKNFIVVNVDKISNVSDMVLVYTNDGNVHVLNKTAGLIFESLVGGNSKSEIVDKILGMCVDAKEIDIMKDVEDLIIVLKEKGIIEEAE